MFIIQTRERAADDSHPRRVLTYRDGVLHASSVWDDSRDSAWNHRNAALHSLLVSGGGVTVHHIIGAAPVPGEDFWVVAVQEGE